MAVSVACMQLYAGFLIHGNTHSEIHFSWNEAIDSYIEQILTTKVSDKKQHWIFIFILDNFTMVITFCFTFL